MKTSTPEACAAAEDRLEVEPGASNLQLPSDEIEPALGRDQDHSPTAETLTPFLKWPGGKRWFVCNYANLIPKEFDTYVEPFLGAGSVYFHLRPRQALLGDINPDLVNAYRAIKEDWETVSNSLRYRQRRHREDADSYYYWLRDRTPSDPAQQASRLIYLNRTCFNGIYRVNKRGQFNVPRGTKDKVVIETDDFEGMSRALRNAELVVGDFESLVERADSGDFVFCDPPYTVRHNHNGFRKYNEVIFSWADQERLASSLLRAARRGVKVLCTNANHQSVRDLYSDPVFDQIAVSRYSSISASNSSRRSFEELVIRANI
ncbi:DNA adenine methylase [Burkholderia ubonensis]|uniref:DNA adenine methylase n=1 Tax=Burkholderia ubonensis TaxID=101571 RepID=UPI000B014A07|nr:Dam family site-specific DNA-(adenine-N6)-methyltransferase [Burkholderia ubonensis]